MPVICLHSILITALLSAFPGSDAVFVPTPQDVVEKMLELAKVKKEDLVYDLGCGDGRIVVTAARKCGCKAVGYDINPQCVRWSRENVRKHRVSHLVTIEQRDVLTLDLRKSDVITLYLPRELNARLIPQLRKLKPGSRIVAHDYEIPGISPDKVVTYRSKAGFEHTLYLWVTPLQIQPTRPIRSKGCQFVNLVPARWFAIEPCSGQLRAKASPYAP